MSQSDIYKPANGRIVDRPLRINGGGGKALIYGAAAVAIVGLGYVAVKSLVSPGPPGGGCNDPSSPCYAAIQPYQQAWQQCSNEYAYYQHQFDVENAASKTGLTIDQQNTLDYYRNCMDQAAKSTVNAAKDFIPTQGLQNLLVYIGEGVAVSAVAYAGLRGGSSIVRALRTPSGNGSAVASDIKNTAVRSEVNAGEITATDASVAINDTSLQAAILRSSSNLFYADQEVVAALGATEAAAISSEVDAAIEADARETITILAGL